MSLIYKHIKLLVCFIFIATQANANDDRINKANQLYIDGNFENAIEIYQEVLNSGVEASEIYYNLGNSYYRHGLLPAAILNYERALLLAPQDKDIRHNLNLAYSQITDKIEPVGDFFLARWFANIRNSADSDSWAIGAIITFIMFLAAMLLFLFAKTSLIKKLMFFVAIILFVSSLITFSYSNNQKQRLVNRDMAIIFSPSVTVRSAPQGGGTELFVLHEGTRVKILQKINQWFEIELQDGNVGWMHSEHLEII